MRNGDGPSANGANGRSSGEPRILVVDDDEAIREFILRVLEQRGYPALGVESAIEAREVLARCSFDLAFCDIRMPGETGLELIQRLRELAPELTIVMISGLDDPMMARIALDNGASGYLVKPFGENELLIAAEAALHRRRHEEHLQT